MKDGADTFCNLEFFPNYKCHGLIRCTFIKCSEGNPDDQEEDNDGLFQFWLSPEDARLLVKMLTVAADTNAYSSFQLNYLRLKP